MLKLYACIVLLHKKEVGYWETLPTVCYKLLHVKQSEILFTQIFNHSSLF